MFFNLDKDFVNQRKGELEKYLRDMLQVSTSIYKKKVYKRKIPPRYAAGLHQKYTFS